MHEDHIAFGDVEVEDVNLKGKNEEGMLSRFVVLY